MLRCATKRSNCKPESHLGGSEGRGRDLVVVTLMLIPCIACVDACSFTSKAPVMNARWYSQCVSNRRRRQLPDYQWFDKDRYKVRNASCRESEPNRFETGF